MLRWSATWLVLFSVLGCGIVGPIGPLPGGALDGRVIPPPADWSNFRDYRTIQLETRPQDPYSVNVWGVGVGQTFYVACLPGSRWLPFIEENADVRLRIRNVVFELRAVRSRDPAEFTLYLREMKALYDWEPSQADAQRALLFRLERR